MKKLRLLLLLALFSSPALAQTYILVPVRPMPAGFGVVEVGLRGQASLASVTGNTRKTFAVESKGQRLRGGLGVFTDVHFNRYLGMQLGLDLVDRGGPYRAVFTLTDNRYRATPPTKTFTTDYNLRMRYVQLPFLLKGFTGELGNRTRFYFQGGISLAIALQGSTTVNGRTHDPGDGRRYAEEFGFGDFGLLAGTGVEYQLSPLLCGFAGLTYYHGLEDVLEFPPTSDTNFNYNQASGLPGSDFNLHHRAVGLEFGLKLTPWRQREARRAPAAPEPPKRSPDIRTI